MAAQSAQTNRRMPSSNSIGTAGCFSRAAGALSVPAGSGAGGGSGTTSGFTAAGSGIGVVGGGEIDALNAALATTGDVTAGGFGTAAGSAGDGAGDTAGLIPC